MGLTTPHSTRSRGRLIRWWRQAGVQVRSAVAAAALVSLLVVAAGAVLLIALENGLDSSIDAGNTATADGIAALVTAELAQSTAPVTDPTAPGRLDLQDAITVAAGHGSLVQVLTADGEVIASSAELAGAGPVTGLRPAAGESAVTQVHLRFDEDAYRFTALGGQVGGHRFSVLVGASLGIGEKTLHAAVAALAVAGPLLLVTVAGATFLFIGRSLRPVTDIRTTVERISDRDLGERVPVPPGRDEVAKLARTMNTMLAGLQSSTTAQRQFVSDASHELRSPIATLRAAADIALTVPGRIDLQSLATLVSGEAKRLDGLVADLLLLARVDELGRQRAEPQAPRPDSRSGRWAEEIDLDDLVSIEAKRLRTTTLLEVGMHRSPARVLGDPTALSRVLRNLTDNAVRHAVSRVSITLRSSPSPEGEGAVAVVEICNDGPAIPEADRGRVFDRFVRLEASRARDSGGSGLGLAIVEEIVLAHGGRVSVLDPPENAGACFRVELPLAVLPEREA